MSDAMIAESPITAAGQAPSIALTQPTGPAIETVAVPAAGDVTVVREVLFTAFAGGVEAAKLYEKDGKTTYTAVTGAGQSPLKVTFSEDEMVAIGAIGAISAKHPKLVDKLLGSLDAAALRTLFTLVNQVVEVGVLPGEFDPNADTVLS